VVACEVAGAKKQGNNCLIGKIWAGKRVNKEGFISVFKRIWQTKGFSRRSNQTCGCLNLVKRQTR
jgi:hypothetical protein